MHQHRSDQYAGWCRKVDYIADVLTFTLQVNKKWVHKNYKDETTMELM